MAGLLKPSFSPLRSSCGRFPSITQTTLPTTFLGDCPPPLLHPALLKDDPHNSPALYRILPTMPPGQLKEEKRKRNEKGIQMQPLAKGKNRKQRQKQKVRTLKENEERK